MARGDQLIRQWRIIQWLNVSRYGKTATQIADRLKCHPRSVYRDLAALETAGFPLFADIKEGKKQWQLMKSAREGTPLPLELPELMALYFSCNLLKSMGSPFLGEALSALLEKIRATLPADAHDYLDQYTRLFQFSALPKKSQRQFGQLLDLIQKALAEQRSLDISYYAPSRKKESRRRVDAHGIRFFDGTYYLIGHCHLRDDLRIFALDRIRKMELADETFSPLAPEKLDNLMADSFGIFRGDAVKVGISFSSEVADYIKEVKWHASQKITPKRDGSIVLEMTVAGLDEVKYWVLKWGKDARVLFPESLRAAVLEEARQILKQSGTYPGIGKKR